ncbi:MAG: phage holin family protein [Minisyncoccia bacterium]
MHWLLKFAIIVAGNGLALWLADKFVPGFVLQGTWMQIVLVGLVLALLNGLLKPLLTLVLGPIIVLTLGLGVLVVNALILWLLPLLLNYIDFLHGTIIIQDIPALIYATLIISIVNFIIHIIA